MANDADGTDNADSIKLDQFLKLADVVASGGEAKHLIRSGAIRVNGETELRRGRTLHSGDVVQFGSDEFVVESQ